MRIVLAFVVIAASAAAAADPKPDPKQLAAARLAAATSAVELARKRYEAGVGTLDGVYAWSVRVLDATLDGARGKAIKDALQAHAAYVHDLDAVAQKRVSSGIADPVETLATAYYMAEADLWVARGKR